MSRPAPTRPVRTVLATAAVAVVVVVSLLAAPSANAASTPAPSGAAVRVAHLSPGTPSVNVSLTSLSGGSIELGQSEAYGETSRYQTVPPGVYTVVARRTGSPASAQPLFTWTVDAKAGEAYTAAAVGIGAEARGAILRDDLTPPAAGKGSVRFIQAASATPAATLTTVGGTVVASPTDFGTATGYAQIPAGTWPLTASGVADPAVQAQRQVSVSSGAVLSVILLDQPGGGVTLRSTVDASGTSVTPRGGVDTGGGAVAAELGGRTGTPVAPPAGLLAAGALAAGLLIAGLRRARPSTTRRT